MRNKHASSVADMLIRAFLTTFLTTVAIGVARKLAVALTEMPEGPRPAPRKMAKVRRVARTLPRSMNVPHRVTQASRA